MSVDAIAFGGGFAGLVVAIREPPFYAIPLCTGLTGTMGGLAIDPACHVLRPDGSALAAEAIARDLGKPIT